ncbi:beta-ketoacyl-[acyl-carrier-protein] synthase family protein [Micromonospora zhanjiangensis]
MAGVGAVSAAGLGADRLWSAVTGGRVLTGPVTRFDVSGYPTRRAGEVPAAALAALAGPVPAHESLVGPVPGLESLAGPVPGPESLAGRYLAAAVLEALAHAGLAADYRREVLGLYVGTVMGTRPLLDRGIEPGRLRVSGSGWARADGLLDPVRAVVRGIGPAVLVGPGCSSGNAAIAAGFRAVRAGEVDVAVCAGVDELSLEVFAMFTSLRALAPDVVRPFDADRRGTMPAEGAGVLVLERADRLATRGGPVRARLLACASAADAYHPTQPHPDGAALVATMQAALARAGRQPDDVDWVCAHGTGTPANDGVEARATAKVLAGRDRPVVSSVKGQLGHAVGAAAALEAVLVVRALAEDFVPGNVTLHRPDPECDGIDLVPPEGRRTRLDLVASPAFGFGGAVTTLLFGKGDGLPVGRGDGLSVGRGDGLSVGKGDGDVG